MTTNDPAKEIVVETPQQQEMPVNKHKPDYVLEQHACIACVVLKANKAN